MAKLLSFGASLRKERMDRNVGLNKFAKQMGIQASYLCDIEYDKRVPSRKAILKIVKTLIPAIETLYYERRLTLFDDLLEKSSRMTAERRALLQLSSRGPGLTQNEISEVLWGELNDGV